MFHSRAQMNWWPGNIDGAFYMFPMTCCALLAGIIALVLRLQVGLWWIEVLTAVILGGIVGLLLYLHIAHEKAIRREHQDVVPDPLKRLSDAGLIAVYCWDGQGNITYANNAALKMLGRQPSEIGVLRLEDIIAPIEHPAAPRFESTLKIRTLVGHQANLLRKDGRPLFVYTGATRWIADSDEYVAFAIDISASNGSEKQQTSLANEIEGQQTIKPEVVSHSCATILLVEDQQALRELLKEVLSSAGFRVLEAQDGMHAVDLAAEYEGTIDLMLTDWVMPGMDGGDAACRVRQQRPAIKVVYMSGYSEEVVKNGLPSHEIFLEKPVRPDVLINSIRSALNNQVTISSNGKARAA